jgi:hypothetical protein
MVSQTAADLTQRQEALQHRESSLQERMDCMLNQRRVSLEQETEQKRAESLEAHRVDFRTKTAAALERYKQGWEALERQVRNRVAKLRKAHEMRMGAERALEQADTTMGGLQREMSRIGEENEAMVQQIVGLTKELQEAKVSQEEALLRRQWVQMFRDISARVMEEVRRLALRH